MSDTSILPGATLPEAGTTPPGPAGLDDPGPGDDRRRLLIIGGIVAAVLVLVVAYLLLKGGGSSSPSDSSAGLVPRGTPAASAPSTSGSSGSASKPAAAGSGNSGKGKAGTVLPKKTHTRLARDPFKPLVAAAVPGTGSVVGSTTVSPAPGSVPGTVPTTPAQGGSPGTSFGSPQAVRLLKVRGAKSAVFEVSYAHHKAFRYDVVAPSASSARGTVFAQDFALLGIQGNDVTVQVGDATPFDLKVGASHTV
ncbi:MAG TPA: hypothetical protein VG650_00135 [Mycobacteriales bacterium]|nr:hypothetical protein [Mycobacteriales bacterium]